MGLNNQSAELAINGGYKVRPEPMPARFAFGPDERRMIDEVFRHYDSLEIDPGYQGAFQARYCDAFSGYQGGGYTTAVATGSLAIYLSLKALELPKGSSVLVSPITDPGSISTIIEAGLSPRLMDAAPDGYNAGAAEVEARLSSEVSAVLIVHATGIAANVDEIATLTKARGIRLIEDCSQSHGASRAGQKVGNFGDIAAFSTMYRKPSISGGSGGLVFTRDEAIFRSAVAYSDRGKPRWKENFDDRDPTGFLFPAMNLNTDEISCAIGIASLARLDATRARRLKYIQAVAKGLDDNSMVCRCQPFNDFASPFVCPVFIDLRYLLCSKEEFAKAVLAEGINLNPHYMYVVRDWPWLTPYLADNFDTPVARSNRDNSFCLYVNENYGQKEISDTLEAILKVEKFYTVHD